MKNGFAEYCDEHGFGQESSTIRFGVIGGYAVRLTPMSGRLWMVNIPVEMSGKLPKELQREFKTEGFGRASLAQNQFTSTLTIDPKNTSGSADLQLQRLTDLLRRNQMPPLTRCDVCRGEGSDILTPSQTGCVPMHRTCLAKRVDNVKATEQRSLQTGNYLTGIIGAICGTVVGVLPSLFTIMLSDSIYAVLFALIPLSTYYGYRLCKGKMTRAVLPITIVLSLCSVFLIHWMLVAALLMTEYGFSVGDAVLSMLSLMSDLSLWISVVTDQVMTFVFIGLGIWFAWGAISRNSNTVVQSSEQLLRIAVPYPVGIAAAPATAHEAQTSSEP